MSATVPGTSGSANEGSAVVLDGALQGFRDMLAADGYELNWSVTGQDAVTGQGKVRIQIVAGPDACADCLVPLPVIEGIIPTRSRRRRTRWTASCCRPASERERDGPAGHHHHRGPGARPARAVRRARAAPGAPAPLTAPSGCGWLSVYARSVRPSARVPPSAAPSKSEKAGFRDFCARCLADPVFSSTISITVITAASIVIITRQFQSITGNAGNVL
jgi:hypothetical protein